MVYTRRNSKKKDAPTSDKASRVWTEKEANKILKVKLMNRLHVSRPMAQIIAADGIGFEEAEKLLNDPTDLFELDQEPYGCREVAEAIIKSVKNREAIRIFADYDVDGLCSGFIMKAYLKCLGVKDVKIHIPEREDGYGLNLEWSKEIVKEKDSRENKTYKVICVDNGITAHQSIGYLKDNQIDTIVIDHHEPIETLPEAIAICDAWIDRKYGTHLCAAAVVWKVITKIEILLNHTPEEINEIVMSFLPYIAMATISDVMEPNKENRAIVQAGLNAINEGYSPMINAIMKIENIDGMRTKDISWTVSPMINACARMGNAKAAAELFEKELDQDNRFAQAVKDIDDINRKRKNETENAVLSIMKDNDFSLYPVVIVNAGKYTKYTLGLQGIIAGNLVELTGKPAIAYSVGSDGIGRGSGRAPAGISIKDIVNYEAEKGNAVGAMGHAEACGISLFPEKIIDFEKDVMDSLIIEAKEPEEMPPVLLDAIISPDDMNMAIREEINSFGYTSRELPKLGILNVEVNPIPWETRSGKRHLLLEMKNSKGKSRYAIGWNMLDKYEELGSPRRVNISGSLDSGAYCRYCKQVNLNEWSTVLTIDMLDKS